MSNLSSPIRDRALARPAVGLTLIALLVSLSVAVGCGAETDQALEQTESGLTVTPEFRVIGADAVGDEVYLQDLFLGVGEIRLEPLGEVDEVIYVTRTPMFLHFDLAAGEWQLEGMPLTLPHGGEYLISIRLEPLESNVTSEATGHSLRMNGLFAKATDDDGVVDVNTSDPMPLPWRLHDDSVGSDRPVEGKVDWVPWTYATERDIGIVLNDVQFDDTDEEQSLVITFDLSAWLSEAFTPIQVAVESTERQAIDPQNDGRKHRVDPLDVSDDLDGLGAGAEELNASTEAIGG